MFWSTRNLMEVVIQAEDGEVGRCKDLLVDDRHWCIRYMVVNTHKWLPGRKVLISPIALGDPEPALLNIPVKMTRDQIDSSPPLDTDAPVSRRYEREYFKHFGWPPYWIGMEPWGAVPYPHLAFEMKQEIHNKTEKEPEESLLRSIKELTDYAILARGQEIGRLHECMVSTPAWAVRYLVVDISKWYQIKGRRILIIPECITDIDWSKKTIDTSIGEEDVKDCPEYNQETPLERNFEIVLHDYYGWPTYWENGHR